ncbi:histone acetyltransferase HPA2 [Vibrio sp. JCM 19236]|nr:histone acetyltransferase HPA2 [Vibrio sp. JCM 19236]
MSLEIVKVSKQYDADLCQVIKSVGAEYGAVGEGFGPSDAEVENMSQFYTAENQSYIWSPYWMAS